jgi:peptidoglycan/xylan/chitin deacetylase (PgdA/CDA1 family)
VFSREQLVGTSLPEGTLSLTFDDGPGVTRGDGRGPKTQRLAEYLADQSIPATFFVCGKHVAQLPGVVGRLRELGHAVGNHTQNHPDLVGRLESGADIAGELTSTDLLIRAGDTLFFRPPYGSWSPDVADALNADVELAGRYIGPVHWEIDGDDWAAWRDGLSPDVVAQTYLTAVAEQRRGIVLMHDSTADHDDWVVNNGTFEAIQLIVPALRERGYAFVALDTVPEIAGALPRGGG